jgi:hypothetical protein
LRAADALGTPVITPHGNALWFENDASTRSRKGIGSRSPRTASSTVLKTRLKELVKRHHPDANGGDRSSEGKLREIIQAYNYLKSIWFR